MVDFDGTMPLEEEDTQKDRYLSFLLGNESFCIEIANIIEIIGIQPITEIPELPTYIKGVVNLRGKIIPVIDVRQRLKKTSVEYNSRTCIVIVDIKSVYVGLIVDNVAEVTTIPEEDISKPADFSKNAYIRGIGKVDKDVKLILDCEKIMSEDEIEKLSIAI